MSEFRTRFRELRKSLDLTLREMSEDIGIPLSSISKYEQGIIKPGVEILSKIAKRYKVNLNWLIANQGLMFEPEDVACSNGEEIPVRVRLVKYENNIKIHPLSNDGLTKDIDVNSISISNPDEALLEVAKSMNKPVTVEFSNMGEDDNVKVFYPDGDVKVFNIDEDTFRNVLLKKVKSKLGSVPYDSNKLEFLDAAIDSLEDKSAFDHLKTLVKGMDIALN